VLCNLLENAAKYSSEAATIEVRANKSEQFVSVSVIDAGTGFAQEPSQLFEMFTRGISDTNQSGMGLGLAICKEIVEAHGGWISAKNNESKIGSVITFTLPITENAGLPKL
jgi:two-component system sensor histidine kinase KdpD